MICKITGIEHVFSNNIYLIFIPFDTKNSKNAILALWNLILILFHTKIRINYDFLITKKKLFTVNIFYRAKNGKKHTKTNIRCRRRTVQERHNIVAIPHGIGSSALDLWRKVMNPCKLRRNQLIYLSVTLEATRADTPGLHREWTKHK